MSEAARGFAVVRGVISPGNIMPALAIYASRPYIRCPIRRLVVKYDPRTNNSIPIQSRCLLFRYCVCALVNNICGGVFAFLVVNQPRVAKAFGVFLWPCGKAEMRQSVKLLFIDPIPITTSSNSDQRPNQAQNQGYARTGRAIVPTFAHHYAFVSN